MINLDACLCHDGLDMPQKLVLPSTPPKGAEIGLTIGCEVAAEDLVAC
jgi:hypothetical protein